MLIFFERAVITLKEIIDLITRHLSEKSGRKAPVQSRGNKPRWKQLPGTNLTARKLVNHGLLASSGLNLIALVLGWMQAHVFAGVAFAVILGLHLFHKRRTLMG